MIFAPWSGNFKAAPRFVRERAAPLELKYCRQILDEKLFLALVASLLTPKSVENAIFRCAFLEMS